MAVYGTVTDIVTGSRHARPSTGLGRWVIWLAVVTLAMIGAGCGSDEPQVTPATVDGDRILFERGQAALEEENWGESRDYFLQVRDSYPQSDLRADVRLGIADTYEGQGNAENYVSALAEYQDFLSLYPTHPRAPYAQFKLAMVHHHQMRQPERDQSWTLSAIREFELFIERYPNSELMGEVSGYLRGARDRLSESEFIVGRYYYRNNWWPGAIDRLRAVLESDPQFTGSEPVYFYLADALYNSGELKEALPTFRRLLEEFPETEFIEDATAAMADIETRLEADRSASTAPDEADDDKDSDAVQAPISG